MQFRKPSFKHLPGLISLLVASLLFPPAQPSRAQPNLVWPSISLTPLVSGLQSPVHLTHSGDGSGRLFVVEQAGRIKIVENAQVIATFLDISARVLSPSSGGGGEEGLLSLAFPPGFGQWKDYFYVYYTNRNGNNQVSRFRLGNGPNSADPNSEELILLLNHPTYSNHNGGQLAFGPDGYLYIGTGDGGGGGDPNNNAQNPASLLGKLLRIDVEMEASVPVFGHNQVYLPLVSGISGTAPKYLVPASNPFVNTPGYRPEIWALGLRNPWRFSFDRQSGEMYIGDVGQDLVEEVDWQPANQGGQNYGWDMYEGTNCYTAPCNPSGKTMPVTTYTHTGGNCSITGGVVYRGAAYAGLQGIYFFADYCSGNLWGLARENNTWVTQLLLTQGALRISSFGEDQAGEVYLLDRQGGVIYRLAQN